MAYVLVLLATKIAVCVIMRGMKQTLVSRKVSVLWKKLRESQ
jgi:hypothetical protein